MKASLFDFPLFPLSERSESEGKLVGTGSKNVLIVVDWEEEEKVLSSFLVKVLAAVKLDLSNDVFILPVTPAEPIGLHNLLSGHNIHKILVFGPFTDQLGLHFDAPLYHPVEIDNRFFLQTDTLKAIFDERQAGGKQKAGALWNNLKSLFLQS